MHSALHRSNQALSGMAFALHAHARAAPRYAAPAGSRRCSARRAAPAAAPRRALTSQPRRIVLGACVSLSCAACRSLACRAWPDAPARAAAAAAGGGDPFAASAPPPPPGAAPPAGFLASTEDRNRLLPVRTHALACHAHAHALRPSDSLVIRPSDG